MTRSSKPLAIGLMLLSVLSAAALGALVKSLDGVYSLVQLVFARSLFATLFLAGFIPFKGGWPSLTLNNKRSHVVRCIYGILATSLYFLSVEELTFAEATILGFCAPFLTALLSSAVGGEAVERRAWIAIMMGFGGVLVCILPISVGASVGMAAGLGGALFLALSRLEVRKLSRTDSSFAMTFHFSATVAVLSGAATAFNFRVPTATDLGIMVLLGVTGAAAQTIQAQAHRYAPAAFLAPLDYTSLVWAAVFGYAFWGENIDGKTVTGAIIIIAAGVLLSFQSMPWRNLLGRPVTS